MSLISGPPDSMQKIRRIVSQLEYAYEDRPDANSLNVAQWERAMAGKVNTLAYQLNPSAEMPPALPPLTLCGLYLHNIRSSEGGIFDFAQLRPVDREHPVLTDPQHTVGIPVDFEGDQFPLLPRDKIRPDWWRSWGATSRASATPGLGRMSAAPESVSMARSATRLPPASSVLDKHPTCSVSAHPVATPATSRTMSSYPPMAGPITPTTKADLTIPRSQVIPPAVPHSLSSVKSMENEMDIDEISKHPEPGGPQQAAIDDDKKRKASRSPARLLGDERKRSRSNIGVAYATGEEDQQVRSKRITRSAPKVHSPEPVFRTEDHFQSSAGNARLPSWSARPSSEPRLNATADVTLGHQSPGKDCHRTTLSAADTQADKGKEKGKGKAPAILQDERVGSDEQREIQHKNEDDGDTESGSESDSREEDETEGGNEHVPQCDQVGEEEVNDEQDDGEQQEQEQDVRDEAGPQGDGSEADAQADEDNERSAKEEGAGGDAEEKRPAVVRKGKAERSRKKQINPPELLFDPEELEWAWYEHGQKIRACYQAYRWWKQQCRPDVHPGKHPHPGDQLHDRAIPDWFRDMYHKLHVSDPPPPPKVTDSPCGKPTVATLNHPRFAHLGHAAEPMSEYEGDGAGQKDQAAHVEANNTGAAHEGGEADRATRSASIKVKVERQSKKSQPVVYGSDDELLSFPGPRSRVKTKVQTKPRPKSRKRKTVEESDIEVVSDGETFGKAAREQAKQTKDTAGQDSDVKLVPDVPTMRKVAPKPKKQKTADDSDVEIVEDPQPVPKDEKKKKKNAGARPPATSSSSGSRRMRRGQLVVVIPPSNIASRPHQPAMPSPSADDPAEMMDITPTRTVATYMTEVGLPPGMKRWRSSGHSTSRGADDVQRLHVRGVVRSMDADSSPQKCRNDVEVEDNVRGDSRHGPENIGEDGNQDETAKAGKDVAIGDDSTVDRRVDDEKEDPFEFSECGSVPEPPQSSDGAFEVSISQTTSSLTPWSAAAGSTGPGSRDTFGKVSSSRIPMGPSGVETLTHHSPATSRADEMALSDVPDVAVSAIGEDVVLARQEHTIGSREESALSLALAVQAAVPGHANITVTPATADQQLAAVLKVTDTVRDTLHGTYRILASRYQQGNQTLPPDTDATSGVDQLSHRLRNLTVDLWLFGSMFDVISTCFEMLAGVLKLDNSMGLPLDRMADATRILVDLYNASGQESDRLRDMLTRPRPGGSAEAGSDVRLAAAAEDMRWPMRAMEPELAHLPAKLIDGLRGHEEDIPQLLLNAARVLAAGAQVVQNEREAMGDVVQSLAPTPAPVLTTLRSVHPDTQVFGPAFPSTLEVMDTLSRVSKQLLELEQDVTSLKQGKFIEDYLKTLGVTPASLQAVAQFAKTLARVGQ
ncbi:hypothetical protein LXA43DRAFT_1067236 [Ganoderma leucocontextum]|nr:hypothetical protein LXA43DRAFT_1067236 [Ganoderma leucocontextum]